MMTSNTTKLAIIAVLGALAILLGTLCLTLQILIAQRKQINHRMSSKSSSSSSSSTTFDSSTEDGTSKSHATQTMSPTFPTDPKDLFLFQKYAPHPQSKRFIGQSYWNQAETYLATLGDAIALHRHPHLFAPSPESSTSKPSSQSQQQKQQILPQYLQSIDARQAHTALQQAANWGHGDAQHYVASALSSGIWPTNATASSQIIQDMDQVPTEALLNWHMASMEANLEALTSMTHRVWTSTKQCSKALPYSQETAHVIIDLLETDPHSRAKITPPMDKHALPEIHMHGGTSVSLTWDNKPDESAEAIQYYHLLSTQQEPDVLAAYTLAHLYHYGLRGLPQNMTLAYFYYEIAAQAGHAEAAGQAGKFHVWSLGMEAHERDLHLAHRLFLKGAPDGLEECRAKYKQARKEKQQDQSIEETSVKVCDHPSLNGLGLLHLFGIPMVVPVDIKKAKKYFELARDMGNMDASYNLAMLRLGYKSHWKTMSAANFPVDAGSGRQTMITQPDFLSPKTHPSEQDVLSALQELTSAANKGHIQARHRLGMLYSEGWMVPGSTKWTIPPDCTKAMVHYRWVAQQASPSLSLRTRTAYKQYMAGDLDKALLNYMMAAETGHTLSQVNAAFLLERGVCKFFASPQACRLASLRYWKAAAQAGHAVAALSVGDYYYYGSRGALPHWGNGGNIANISWMDIVLYPEIYFLPWIQAKWNDLFEWHSKYSNKSDESENNGESKGEDVCRAPDDEELDSGGSCQVVDNEDDDADWEKAAEYYRIAATEHKSARANYNLGFMHEWGLGLAQDFPLAKRHYDLAGDSKQGSSLAVQIALLTLYIHEQALAVFRQWQEWNRPEGTSKKKEGSQTKATPTPDTPWGVIMHHLWSWDTLIIVVLSYILWGLTYIQPRPRQR